MLLTLLERLLLLLLLLLEGLPVEVLPIAIGSAAGRCGLVFAHF